MAQQQQLFEDEKNIKILHKNIMPILH